jgi:hypothetical protein
VARSLFPLVIAVCGTCAVLTRPAAATLYQPDDPTAVPVSENGTPDPFPFPEFKRRLVTLVNEANPDLDTPERGRLLDRINRRKAAKSLTPDETAALAADLLRAMRTRNKATKSETNLTDEAVNRLKPLYDDRERKGTRTYLVTAALVHAHAAREEWDQAVGYYADLLDLDPPASVPKLTAAQWKWQLGLDRGAFKTYLLEHRKLAAQSADAARRAELAANEEVFPLFPVRFVNDAGKYEPGKLAAAERAKLPADAVAVVQQLLLWFPTDTRLYWLLGELYAADGKLVEARQILNECRSEARTFGNRKVLLAHRDALWAPAEADAAARAKADADARQKADEEERAKAEAEAREKEEAAKNALPISLRTVWVYFGVVAAVAAVAAARVIARRVRGPGAA